MRLLHGSEGWPATEEMRPARIGGMRRARRRRRRWWRRRRRRPRAGGTAAGAEMEVEVEGMGGGGGGKRRRGGRGGGAHGDEAARVSGDLGKSQRERESSGERGGNQQGSRAA